MGKIQQWIIDAAHDRNIPLNTTIELGLGCNLACKHCYNFDRSQTRPDTGKVPLDKERILHLIDELAAAGCLVVAFTGGEALLHPHLFTFIRRARDRNLVVRLKTNGALMTADKVQALKNSQVGEIEVSLYGGSAQVHDDFTRTQGSFVATWTGIHKAIAVGLNVRVNYILHRGCVDEFPEMLKKVNDLGIEFSVSTELTKRYDETEDSLDLRLTREDLRKLYTGSCRDFFATEPNPQDSVQCGCAKINCGIGYDGTVYPCIGAPIPSGSLLEQSFADIWANSAVFREIRGLTLKSFKDCAPCDKRAFCQRSSGAVYTNTGDYTGKEQWTCDQAELLKELHSLKTNEQESSSAKLNKA